MLAICYSAEKIAEVLPDTNFGRFNDGNWVFTGGMYQFRKYYGWDKGKRIGRWFESLIASQAGNGDMMFSELHELALAKNQYKDLHIAGTNLSMQKAGVFSYESFPQMKIRDALRISMSIPLYYRPVYMDRAGNIYHRAEVDDLYIMVDGGLMNNYPINFFDNSKYAINGEVREVAGLNFMNPETLGFYIPIYIRVQTTVANSISRGMHSGSSARVGSQTSG